MGELILVLGGARSGKSAFARDLAGEGPEPVVFVATMEPNDDEVRRRIARHRKERPAGWRTVEAPTAVIDALNGLTPEPGTVLLDCLSLWVANLLQEVLPDEPAADQVEAAQDDVLRRVEELLDWWTRSGTRLIVVSNEVGQGIVPTYPLGRSFRDVLGTAHQLLAREAGLVYVMTAGIAREIKADAFWVRRDHGKSKG